MAHADRAGQDGCPMLTPDAERPTARSPIGFAHHGAGRREPPSSMAAFALAERLGVAGLASTVWTTADGRAVLDPTGVVGGRLRRRALADVSVVTVAESVVRLDELFATVGPRLQLALDVGDPSVVAEVIAVARDARAEDRLWLCHEDAELVARWRPLSEAVRLVHVTRLRAMKPGPERRSADLRASGIDGVRLPQADWSAGLVALVHRFDLLALAADAHFARTVGDAVAAGVDGVYSDDPELLTDLAR
jgi:glycerophosphoryl diester phosphodiesterase